MQLKTEYFYSGQPWLTREQERGYRRDGSEVNGGLGVDGATDDEADALSDQGCQNAHLEKLLVAAQEGL